MEIADEKMGIRARVSTVLAGLSLVLLATVIGVAIQGGVGSVELFEQFVRPFTLAAAGIGAGHYLGRSFRDNQNARMHFAFGFFLGLFIEAIYYTRSSTIGPVPLPAVVVLGFTFSIFMHLSPLIPSDDEIQEMMHIFAGPVATSVLLLGTIIKFILAMNLQSQDAVFGLLGIGSLGALLIYAHDRGKQAGQGRDFDR
jgi:type IV secretory pathway VirB2 component (pilin)